MADYSNLHLKIVGIRIVDYREKFTESKTSQCIRSYIYLNIASWLLSSSELDLPDPNGPLHERKVSLIAMVVANAKVVEAVNELR